MGEIHELFVLALSLVWLPGRLLNSKGKPGFLSTVRGEIVTESIPERAGPVISRTLHWN